MAKYNLVLRKKILAQIPEVQKCFQCGTCTSTCTASRYLGQFNPREIVYKCLQGDKKVFGDYLFRCITCNRCNQYCPQGVNPFDVIIKLKNIAYQEGLLTDEKKAELDAVYTSILESGSTFVVNDTVKRQREKFGLRKLGFDNKAIQALFEEKKPVVNLE